MTVQHKITREIDRGRNKGRRSKYSKPLHDGTKTKRTRKHARVRKSKRKPKKGKCRRKHKRESLKRLIQAHIDSMLTCIKSHKRIAKLMQTKNGKRLSRKRRHKIIDSGATHTVHWDVSKLKHPTPANVSGIKGVSGVKTKITTQGKWLRLDTLNMPIIEDPIISVGRSIS